MKRLILVVFSMCIVCSKSMALDPSVVTEVQSLNNKCKEIRNRVEFVRDASQLYQKDKLIADSAEFVKFLESMSPSQQQVLDKILALSSEDQKELLTSGVGMVPPCIEENMVIGGRIFYSYSKLKLEESDRKKVKFNILKYLNLKIQRPTLMMEFMTLLSNIRLFLEAEGLEKSNLYNAVMQSRKGLIGPGMKSRKEQLLKDNRNLAGASAFKLEHEVIRSELEKLSVIYRETYSQITK